MAFLPGVGDFFNNLADSITGKTKTDLSQQALDIQAQVAKDTLSQEIQAQQLKYNPALSQQRTEQLAIVFIPLAVGLIIFLIIKFR